MKRFLNAYWLRMSLASARGVVLEADALAKLMLAELYMPDLFGQLLAWLAAGVVADMVAEIEGGRGDHSAGVRDWGELSPRLPADDLANYLLLAASLRGETVEEAVLPPDLRKLATQLAGTSQGTRNAARRSALGLEAAKQVALARYLAAALRQQGVPDAQAALAGSISALSSAPGAAATAAEELARMRHSMITAAMPIRLFADNQPPEFRVLIEGWRDSPEVSERARRACVEALAPR